MRLKELKLIDQLGGFMSRNQAVALAEQLAAKGTNQKQIGIKLAEAGFPSSKMGKPLKASAISTMLKKKKRRSPTAKHASRIKIPKAKNSAGRIDALKTILKLRGVDDGEKIALALLVLD
jgi:hypothetical protein